MDRIRRLCRRVTCAALGFALAALPVLPAGAFANGSMADASVQIGWGGVRGGGGAAERTFACDTVGGSQRIVLSFTAPDSVERFVAADVLLELRAAGERLPAWWEFRKSEACRTLSLQIQLEAAPSGDSTLALRDPWDEGRTGIAVITAYERDDGDPRVAKLSASMARPISKPVALEPGARYVTAAFVIDNRRTIGDYMCEGCREPVTIRVLRFALLEPDGRTTELPAGAEACLGWQGAPCASDAPPAGDGD